MAAGTDKDKEKEKDIAGDAGTGGTTLSDAKELEKGKEAEKVQAPTGDVVVPPSEPTSPPLAEVSSISLVFTVQHSRQADQLTRTDRRVDIRRRAAPRLRL